MNNDKPLVVSLLRQEAVEAAQSVVGAPIKSLGIRGAFLTSFFLLLFITGAVFAIATKYSRKETVVGQIVSVDGSLRVSTARAGIIQNVFVEEGQIVYAGQELVSISLGPTLLHGGSLPDSIESSQLEQADAQEMQTIAKVDQIRNQRAELTARQNGIKFDLKRLAEACDLQVQRVRIQEQIVSAAHALKDSGQLPIITAATKDDDLIVSRQSLAALERESSQQQNLLLQLVAQSNRLSAEEKIVLSDIVSTRAQMKEKRLNTEAVFADHLVSPVAGTITALQARNGAAVVPNQSLAIIVPIRDKKNGASLEVELWAPSRSIGFIKPGNKVRIQYDAFPYQGFGVGQGEVRDISKAPLLPNELPIPIETREQLYRIRVKIYSDSLYAYGRDWPLSPGMKLSADLVLEERSLLGWLLDPLLAFDRRKG